MNFTQRLHESGQSLGLDIITRGLLTSGTLRRYIAELAVTRLTSYPTIFDHATMNGYICDAVLKKSSTASQAGVVLQTCIGGFDPGCSRLHGY
jgi:transaldolase